MYVNADEEKWDFLHAILQRWLNRLPTASYLQTIHTHIPKTPKISTGTGGENKVPSAPKTERYARHSNRGVKSGSSTW